MSETELEFGPGNFPDAMPERARTTFDDAWRWLAEPGSAWTGAQKVAIGAVARGATARPLWDRRPATIEHLESETQGHSVLSPLVVDTVERVAAEAAGITRPWAEAVIAALGDVAYAELVAVVAVVVPIDRACSLLGRDLAPLPDPVGGPPTGERAPATTDIGAFLPVADGFPGANVARSLSVAPAANAMRLRVVRALYSGERFGELRWDDGALDRPQVELLAARTSARNDCFY